MQHPKSLSQLNFSIPGVKTVGVELLQLLNHPNPDMHQIASTCALDPALFGTIIACANTAKSSRATPVTDLAVAVPRLGLREIRRIIFRVVLEVAFQSGKPPVDSFLKKIWTQNLTVALLAQRLAETLPKMQKLPEYLLLSAYSLGLLHSVGMPLLAANYPENFSLFVRDRLALSLPEIYTAERELFDGFTHCQLGAEIIRRWNFPEELAEALQSLFVPKPNISPQSRLLHSLLRLSRHLADHMGFSAIQAPENFWLCENLFQLTEKQFQTISADASSLQQQLSSRFS